MSKDDNGSSQTSDHKHRDIYMYAHTHTLKKIATLVILILFSYFVFTLLISHRQTNKRRMRRMMMEKKKAVRLYLSLHYVIDVCHIHYSSFISPFITPTNNANERAQFIHKGTYRRRRKKKELKYITINVDQTISKRLLFTYSELFVRQQRFCPGFLWIDNDEEDRIVCVFVSMF